MSKHVSKTNGFLFVCGLGLAALSASSADASKFYQFTGEITQLNPNTVSVRRGSQEVEFARPTHLGDLKKGDRITVFYNLDAKQIKSASQAAGQAGGSSDGFLPGVGPDGKEMPEQQIILDDRAFLNANNQARPTPKTTKTPG
jgi:hypothetical protein